MEHLISLGLAIACFVGGFLARPLLEGVIEAWRNPNGDDSNAGSPT